MPTHKITIAITGASGAIYAQLLINRLSSIKDQWSELAVVMTDNAKQIWETEIGNDSYTTLPLKLFSNKDFNAPFASGSGQYNTCLLYTSIKENKIGKRAKLPAIATYAPIGANAKPAPSMAWHKTVKRLV